MGGSGDGNSGPELVTDSVTGFFFAMRVSDPEALELPGVEFSKYEQFEMATVCIRQSKTYQPCQ